jgi:hypothetical protein
MITSVFYFIIGSFLALLSGLLGAISFIIPAQFQAGIFYITSYFNILSGVINLPELIGAMIFFLTFLQAWFGFLGLLWVFGKMPFIGKKENVR